MTKITIPGGNAATFTIPPLETADNAVERIGFSVEETAESLGVSAPTVLRLTKDGTLHSIRIGRRIIVSVESLREFVNGKIKITDTTHAGK